METDVRGGMTTLIESMNAEIWTLDTTLLKLLAAPAEAALRPAPLGHMDPDSASSARSDAPAHTPTAASLPSRAAAAVGTLTTTALIVGTSTAEPLQTAAPCANEAGTRSRPFWPTATGRNEFMSNPRTSNTS